MEQSTVYSRRRPLRDSLISYTNKDEFLIALYLTRIVFAVIVNSCVILDDEGNIKRHLDTRRKFSQANSARKSGANLAFRRGLIPPPCPV